jgi:peptide-methionine (R)-S-oxide reductase
MVPKKVHLSEAEWRKLLNPEAFRILRQSGTEAPFTGKYTDHFPQSGTYVCAGCKTPLFIASSKFPSHCGWPAFSRPVDKGNLGELVDKSYGMERVEIRCSGCDGHLGHIFNDGPKQFGGLRYCINSGALEFVGETTNVAS